MARSLPEALRRHQFKAGHRPWNKGKHYSRRSGESGSRPVRRRRSRRRRSGVRTLMG